jgi:predicted acylesterase/phospholipase RssA
MATLQSVAGLPIQRLFDMWAGTSTGAIETALLAAPSHYSPADVISLYRNDIPKIFNRSFFQNIYSFSGLRLSLYGNDQLISCLKSYVGAYTVGTVPKPILIPTYDKVQQENVYITNTNGAWKDFPLHLAAAASASAPVYFPGLEALGHEFIDGGVVANNPSDVAMVSAKKWFGLTPDQLINRVLVVCFSTGTSTGSTGLPMGNAGGAPWATKIYPVMSDAQSEKTHFLMDSFLEANYQTFSPVFDRSLPLDTVRSADLQYMEDTTDAYMESQKVRVARIGEALARHANKTVGNSYPTVLKYTPPEPVRRAFRP